VGKRRRRFGKTEYSPGTLRINFLRYDWKLDPKDPDGKRELTAMNWSPVLYGCPHVSPKAMGYLKLVGTENRTEKKQ
jgi:hypothetical protein